MKFILGTKQNMTEYFAEDGKMHAATIVAIEPVVVTQIKNMEKDGYTAVQVGYGVRKEKNVTKALKGHFGDNGLFMSTREFRVSADEAGKMNSGDKLTSEVFAAGDVVTVSGISKAKGFQGVIKRHNFKGGPRSHGQKHSERAPGSIGGGLRNRVPKGMRMGGRMGGERITVSNLKVLAVDAETNTLLISGAVPGRRGTMLEIVTK
ncbi:MAG: 50S ribosomal protein L3 [bacterium]